MAAKKKQSKKTAKPQKTVDPVEPIGVAREGGYLSAALGNAAKLTKKVGDWPAGTEGNVLQINEYDSKGQPKTAVLQIRQNANSRVVVNYSDLEALPNGYGGY